MGNAYNKGSLCCHLVSQAKGRNIIKSQFSKKCTWIKERGREDKKYSKGVVYAA